MFQSIEQKQDKGYDVLHHTIIPKTRKPTHSVQLIQKYGEKYDA